MTDHNPAGNYPYELVLSVNHPTSAQVERLRNFRVDAPESKVLTHPYQGERAQDMLVHIPVGTLKGEAVWIHPDGTYDLAMPPDGGMCRGNPTVAACIAGGGCCRRSYACNE